jgi:SAM-dependent methyltransferase
VDPEQWDERYAGDDLLWGAGPNEQVVEQLADLTPGTALDVAGGEGRNAIWLAGRGWDATVVDFSAVALRRARELAAQRGVAVTTVEADVTAWAPAAAVDLVLLAYVQLAGAERRALLGEAAGWVAPGGTLMVVAHDQRNVTHGHGGPPSAEVCYDLDETVAALAGLDVLTAEVVDRHVETADGTAVALDTLVVARAGS